MVERYGLYCIWVLACFGSLASLYIGNPSFLDWCQRVSLFPLIFIASLAAWRGFLGIVSYWIPQVLFGFGCAVYQMLLIKAPDLCVGFYVEEVKAFGFAFSSAALFFSILVLSLMLSKKGRVSRPNS